MGRKWIAGSGTILVALTGHRASNTTLKERAPAAL
jgi:hypothetical protein